MASAHDSCKATEAPFLRPITIGVRPYLSRTASNRPVSVTMRNEQLPCTFRWTSRTPSSSVSAEASIADTTSVGPTMPDVVEYWSWMRFSSNISRIRDSMFVMSPTVTMANVP